MARRETFRLTDLSGGLNLDANPVLIADNQAVECRNFRLDKHGSLLSRRGYSHVTGASPGTITTLGRWNDPEAPNDNIPLVHTDLGEIVGLVSGEWSALTSGLTATRGEFRNVRDLSVFVNGVDRPVAVTGSSAYRLGVTPPEQVVITPVSGDLTGTYRYAVTYYDQHTGSESSPSPVTSASLSSQNASLALVASSETRVDKIRIYRSNAGGTSLLFLAEVDNVNDTYVDDGSVPLTPLAIATDNDLPPALEHIAYFKGYVFGSIGKLLYWSKVFRPDSWPALNVTEVPFEGNDTITALWSYEDTLVIFGRRNTVLLVGNNENDFQLSRLDVDMGCVGRHAICEIVGQLVFLSYDGLRAMPGAQALVPQLSRTLSSLPLSVIERASLAYVPEEHALWVAVNSVIYAIHLDAMAVSVYSINTDQLLSGGHSGFDLPLFLSGDNQHVERYGAATTDLGEPIGVRWKSKVFQLSNPEFTKFIRRIGAFASTGSTSTVTITIADQNRSSTVPLTSQLASGSAEWDDFEWDGALWAAEGTTYFIAALPADVLIGHTMQITVSGNVSAETEIISPISIEYRESSRFLGA